MVTKTIYTDPYQIVIDIGDVPPTQQWLQETTYLIDQAGHTTAMIAQTDRPTRGVSLQPVPFTPVNAELAPSVSTSSPVSTDSHAKSGSSNTIIALAAVGVVFGVVIMATTLCLLRRRALRQRLRAQSSLSISEDSAGSDSSTSSNGVEKFFDETKTSQGVKPALPTDEIASSWKASQEVGTGYENVEHFDASNVSSDEGFLSSSAESKTRNDRLPDRHRSAANVRFGINAWGALPPTRMPVSNATQTREVTGEVAQPTSILKRPARKGLMDTVQGMLGIEDGQSQRDVTNPTKGGVKKTVTFGNAEIREFGRTPLPSSAGSVFSRDDAD